MNKVYIFRGWKLLSFDTDKEASTYLHNCDVIAQSKIVNVVEVRVLEMLEQKFGGGGGIGTHHRMEVLGVYTEVERRVIATMFEDEFNIKFEDEEFPYHHTRVSELIKLCGG